MKFIKYLPLLLLCFLLTSCEKEHDSMGNRGISFYLSSDDTATRVNEKEAFANGDAVGVYVLDKSTGDNLKPAGNFADNRKYIWSSEKESFVASSLDEMIWNSPDKPLEFYVYFPYYSQVTDATQLAHAINGREKEDDFLFAVNRDMDGSQYISLAFNHLLAKVNVKYTSSENRDKTQMSVYTYTDMNINLATGGVSTVTNQRKDISLEKLPSNEYALFSGVVAPQSWEQGEKFGTLTYTGIGSYPFSFAKKREFVSGEEHEVFFMSREPSYIFSVTPKSLSVGAKDPALRPFTVTSTKCDAINGTDLPGTTENLGYALESKPDWVTLSGTNISVAENRTISARSGAVTFKQNESGYKTSIDVSQAAGVLKSEYAFTFSDGTTSQLWNGVANLGDNKSYTIISTRKDYVNGSLDKTENISYSGSASVGWITVTGTNISVAENRTSTARSGAVTFTQSGTGKKITVSISQGAGVTTYNYTFTFSDGTTNKSWNGVANLGGSNNYPVTSTRAVYVNGSLDKTENISYSGSASVGWITVDGTNISVAENRTSTARSGTVIFTQSGSNKTITVSVSQGAGATTYDYTFTFSDGATTKQWSNVAAGGATNSYSITSSRKVYVNGSLDKTENVAYSGSANVGWMSISGTSIIVEDNPNAVPRGGVATFTQSGSNKTVAVNVLQQKKNSVGIDD